VDRMPHVEYCVSAWSPHYKNKVVKLPVIYVGGKLPVTYR